MLRELHLTERIKRGMASKALPLSITLEATRSGSSDVSKEGGL
jgi:hypothetical protein